MMRLTACDRPIFPPVFKSASYAASSSVCENGHVFKYSSGTMWLTSAVFELAEIPDFCVHAIAIDSISDDM